MKRFKIPKAFEEFARVETYLPDMGLVEMLIDVPGKKIYLNRAAQEGANVVQVRFSTIAPDRERPRLLQRRQKDPW